MRLFLGLCVLLVAAKGVASEAYPLWQIEQQIIDSTNRERAKNNLPPLKVDTTLVEGSRRHTVWMARNHCMQHGGNCCENIAMGQRTPQEVLNCWMNSSGHRANILRFRHGRIGVAAYQRNGTIFWTQRFVADTPPAR